MFNAIVLGIIEGITEFLPISSTGHLIILGRQFQVRNSETFDIFIQLGAILAVVVLYLKRFLALLDLEEIGHIIKDKKLPANLSQPSFSGFNGIVKLFVGCLPAFILGFIFHSMIKTYLFSPKTVACALIIGGICMILVEKFKKNWTTSSLETLSIKQAFLIGVFQCCALFPGMSRSASTIVGGMILGVNRATATEFSFLVAVPIMFAAVFYDLLKSASLLTTSDIPAFAIGFVISFITAIFAIKFFLRILERWTLTPFGYYRIVLGVFCLVIFHNV